MPCTYLEIIHAWLNATSICCRKKAYFHNSADWEGKLVRIQSTFYANYNRKSSANARKHMLLIFLQILDTELWHQLSTWEPGEEEMVTVHKSKTKGKQTCQNNDLHEPDLMIFKISLMGFTYHQLHSKTKWQFFFYYPCKTVLYQTLIVTLEVYKIQMCLEKYSCFSP